MFYTAGFVHHTAGFMQYTADSVLYCWFIFYTAGFMHYTAGSELYCWFRIILLVHANLLLFSFNYTAELIGTHKETGPPPPSIPS